MRVGGVVIFCVLLLMGSSNGTIPVSRTTMLVASSAWRQNPRSTSSGVAIEKPAISRRITNRTALPAIPQQLRGSIRHVKLPAGRKLVALTFDLCESSHEIAGYEGRIVEYLRKHKIKATFFAGGHWLMTHKKRAMQLASDPLFEIGNHSWTHANMRHASPTKLSRPDQQGASRL